MKALLSAFLLLAPSITFACPDFFGSWKSSKKDTAMFIENWAKIEDESLDFILQITGSMVITYSSETIDISDQTREIELNGKVVEWVGTNQTVAYELLGCTKNQVVIKYELFNQESVSVLNFQDENIYWVYVGSPEFSENAHYREYFVRQRD